MARTDCDNSGFHALPFDKEDAITRLGSEKLLRSVATMFLKNHPALMTDVRAAADSRNDSRLERAAHKLVSAMAYLSAPEAISAASALEELGREGKSAAAAEPLERLEEAIRRLSKALAEL
jgi:HPt (histidine-containing phosphotransfer) domain-containing protein